MTCCTVDRAEQLLCDLIALRTVNPMGRPHTEGLPVERPVVEYLERLFALYGIQHRRLPCSSSHESLLVTIPGESDASGTLLESHIDTVPADDWLERAFVPRVADGRVFGRGACDDKGSLAAMVLALLELLESGRRPPQPVWLLAAADEEHAQSGIKHFLAAEKVPVGRGVFGEPTRLIPVIQHTGIIRWDITAHGRSAHTSQAELGHNAIHDIMRVIEALANHECQLRALYNSELVGGPSLTVTMIEGGRTRNMVPDQCKIAVDFRVLPEMDPQQAVDDIYARLDTLGLSLEHSEFQCFAPALNTAFHDPFVERVVEVCRSELAHNVLPTGAPYGSDAGWMPRDIPTIVLGPGSIGQAHAVDEYVELAQVVQAAAIYHNIISYDWLQ